MPLAIISNNLTTDTINLIKHPTYILHPQTEAKMREVGEKVDYAEMGLQSIQDYYNKKPESSEIKALFTSVTRIRSANHRSEFLIWDEEQQYVDALGNVESLKRINCGMFNMIIPHFKTVPDIEKGLVKKMDTYKNQIMYEVEFRPEMVEQILRETVDQYAMRFYIYQLGTDECWNLPLKQIDRWAKWDFDALLDYCRTPAKFLEGKSGEERIDPTKVPIQQLTYQETFNPQTSASKNQSQSSQAQPQQKSKK